MGCVRQRHRWRVIRASLSPAPACPASLMSIQPSSNNLTPPKEKIEGEREREKERRNACGEREPTACLTVTRERDERRSPKIVLKMQSSSHPLFFSAASCLEKGREGRERRQEERSSPPHPPRERESLLAEMTEKGCLAQVNCHCRAV